MVSAGERRRELELERVGGIVLCGGQGRRMGRDKASLELDGQTFLQRVVNVVQKAVSPVVVVAAADQDIVLANLDEVQVVRDERPREGPLHGIARGLSHLPSEVTAAYVSSCDAPLLRPEWITFLVSKLDAWDIVLPVALGHEHPLAAVYRGTVEPTARRLLAEERRRPVFLCEQHRTLRVGEEFLRAVDPELDSLRNVNTPEDLVSLLPRWREIRSRCSS